MPCLYGITLAVSDMARSVRPWNAWSNVTTAGLPVALRAIFTAFSTASAPEFANIVRLSNSPGANAFSRSASSMYGSFAVTWKHVCVSSSSCFCAAATTSGGVWPTFRTEMPVAKSISRLPSTSSMIQPEARAVTMGWTLSTAWGMAAFRRSNHSRDFGPGISVRTFRSCGMSIVLPSGRDCPSSVPRRAGRPRGRAPESSSGRGWDLEDAAILFAEVPDIDGRRFHAERREDRADLAPMIRPVVDRLREPDPHRGVGLGPVVAVTHGEGVLHDGPAHAATVSDPYRTLAVGSPGGPRTETFGILGAERRPRRGPSTVRGGTYGDRVEGLEAVHRWHMGGSGRGGDGARHRPGHDRP